MSFRVTAHRRAEEDLAALATWMARQSPDGVTRWLDAYDDLVDQLRENPLAHGLAPEDEFVEPEIRQAFFRTRRGRAYRLLFTFEDPDVRLLRVRGPGQSIVSPDDLGIG